MIKVKSPNSHARIKNASLKNYHSDFLLDNFLETGFRKLLLPLHLLQCLTLAPKYSIRYNLVASNSGQTALFIFLGALLVFFMYNYHIVLFMNRIKDLLKAVYFLLICLQLWSFFAAFLANTLLTVLRSDFNAYLIILLQRIHSSYKFVKMEVKLSMFINWGLLCFMISYHAVVLIFRATIVHDALIFTIMSHSFVLVTDCNGIYMSRVLTLLKSAILSWITEYQHVLNLFTTETEAAICSHVARLENTYKELVQVLRLCQTVFGIPIGFFVVTTFTQAITNVQTLIEEPYWNFHFIYALTWNLRNILLLGVISLDVENICMSMRNLHVTCIMARMACASSDAASRVDSADSTRGASRGLLIASAELAACVGLTADATLTAGGALVVDAALPARVLSTICTYAIVLLQIQFLS